MTRNPFQVLRLATFGGLLALLLVRAPHLPANTLKLFLPLIVLWFVPTLCGGRFTRLHRLHPQLSGNLLYAILDTYLLLMTTAETMSDSWQNPFLLLGAYVFLVSLLGGTRAGGGSAVAGFFASLNGWLMPAGALQGGSLLLAGGAALAGFSCGTLWRIVLPVLIQGVRPIPAVKITPPTNAQNEIAKRIAELEALLRTASAERDQAQERLAEWETQHPHVAPTMPTPTPAAPNTPPATPPTAGAADNLTNLQQMETELAGIQAEKTALLAERQALMAEISGLTKELMAAYAATPETAQQTPPAKEAPHANG